MECVGHGFPSISEVYVVAYGDSDDVSEFGFFGEVVPLEFGVIFSHEYGSSSESFDDGLWSFDEEFVGICWEASFWVFLSDGEDVSPGL